MATPKRITRAVTLTAIIILLAVASLAQAEEDDEVLARVLADLAAEAAEESAARERYECESLFSSDIVLSLPIGDDEGEVVVITLRGKLLDAYFLRTGLDYRWVVDGDTNYQIVLGPDMVAGYYDFSGEDEGERVRADNNFYCKLVGGE